MRRWPPVHVHPRGRPRASTGNDEYLAELVARGALVLDDDNDDSNDPIVGPDATSRTRSRRPVWRPDNRLSAPATRSPALTGVMQCAFGAVARCARSPGVAYDVRRRPTPRPAAAPDVGGACGSPASTSSTTSPPSTRRDPTTSGRAVRPARPTAVAPTARPSASPSWPRSSPPSPRMDADVVGLIEIENDAGLATAADRRRAQRGDRARHLRRSSDTDGDDRHRRHQGGVHLPAGDGDAGRHDRGSSTSADRPAVHRHVRNRPP